MWSYHVNSKILDLDDMLGAPFNIKKLLDSENFELEYICSTLIWKVNFGSQKHLLIWELEGSLLYEVCNYTLWE